MPFARFVVPYVDDWFSLGSDRFGSSTDHARFLHFGFRHRSFCVLTRSRRGESLSISRRLRCVERLVAGAASPPLLTLSSVRSNSFQTRTHRVIAASITRLRALRLTARSLRAATRRSSSVARAAAMYNTPIHSLTQELHLVVPIHARTQLLTIVPNVYDTTTKTATLSTQNTHAAAVPDVSHRESASRPCSPRRFAPTAFSLSSLIAHGTSTPSLRQMEPSRLSEGGAH